MLKSFLSIVAGASLLIGTSACKSTEQAATSVAATSAPAVAFNTAPVDAALKNMVESGRVVGASALVFQGGREVYHGAYGLADREDLTPMARDTLVNIYSMTKPVTSVTLMSLYEDGLFDLDDPISQYLPEYKDQKVLSGVDDDGQMILEDPVRPVTIKDIMTHTGGFTYGWGPTPVDRALREAEPLNPSRPLSQLSQEIAAIPLAFQPGTQWRYSISVDIQARLAEALSGQDYESLVHARVLKPLRMTETGYFVPTEDKPRVSAIYIRGEDGTLTREPDAQVYGFFPEKPVQINGGHGLISTLDDYMSFARMLQNEGSLDGVQILNPETIALMSKDHLPEGISEKDFLPGKGQMGFGLNFAVRIAPPVNAEENPGEVGEFFWDGRASTLFWVDPVNDLTAVFFVQLVPFDGQLHYEFRQAVYAGVE